MSNIIQLYFVDLSTSHIQYDPQPDDAIWCTQANPDCSKDFTIKNCKEFCKSRYDKGEFI